MSKYTVTQVEEMSTAAAISLFPLASVMLRDYAALLRERESAKVTVTDEIATAVLATYVRQCIPHHDDAPAQLRVSAMRDALEAVAPMLASARVPDVLPTDLRIESWPVQEGGMHVGMPCGVKITHIATDRICICNSERSQHKNREIALIGIKAMFAAAPKTEKE